MKKLLVLFSIALALTANAQGYLWRVADVPVPATVPGSTTTNLTSVFELIPGGGCGLILSLTGTDPGDASGVDVTVQGSMNSDGSEATTLLTWTVMAAGTNRVHSFTNLPPETVGLVRYLTVTSLVNSNANSLTNVSMTASTPSPRWLERQRQRQHVPTSL